MAEIMTYYWTQGDTDAVVAIGLIVVAMIGCVVAYGMYRWIDKNI